MRSWAWFRWVLLSCSGQITPRVLYVFVWVTYFQKECPVGPDRAIGSHHYSELVKGMKHIELRRRHLEVSLLPERHPRSVPAHECKSACKSMEGIRKTEDSQDPTEGPGRPAYGSCYGSVTRQGRGVFTGCRLERV